MKHDPGIYIALGSNQPYRRKTPAQTLCFALGALRTAGVAVESASRPWKTPAWPDPADPPFANACARIETDLAPESLMVLLHGLEEEFGRARTVRNAPRTLDLDLVDYRGQVRGGGELLLPHPRAHMRAFVLLPLREVAPRWRHPASGEGIDRLIAALAWSDRQLARPAGPPLKPAAVQRGA
ncbi:2-amino-4-hydroxy-6-hydroxymethyldihydropteridine diphosphokinase [Marinicauda algicola]|uniref:2-amino-4-hydroxy-6-hydroxymethyldihydropteridine pyrophosphokinase n=1 Tax=Marinicauda algicola TaxID=2029849 RepID=A0A4S2GWJ6_9PROT|nr:2-amino-4-hydroxy-6-hydroxymethyldihydropteridine diphosphokinase [Marinicauda algicola]TGY87455.1 2-amino-4-hydroxy-6-hydroxymethyldihydropteridine diphosphokinase [Marinicauda algicola]